MKIEAAQEAMDQNTDVEAGEGDDYVSGKIVEMKRSMCTLTTGDVVPAADLRPKGQLEVKVKAEAKVASIATDKFGDTNIKVNDEHTFPDPTDRAAHKDSVAEYLRALLTYSDHVSSVSPTGDDGSFTACIDGVFYTVRANRSRGQ